MGIPAVKVCAGARKAGTGAVLALALALAACGDKAANKDAKREGPASTTPESQSAPQPSSPSADETEDLPAGPSIGSITINLEPGANGGEPIDVDLVVALDPTADTEIAALDAQTWFTRRNAFVAADRAEVMSWRILPGGGVPETPVETESYAAGVYVFARYATPGTYRKKIEGEGALIITLGASDFTVEIVQ